MRKLLFLFVLNIVFIADCWGETQKDLDPKDYELALYVPFSNGHPIIEEIKKIAPKLNYYDVFYFWYDTKGKTINVTMTKDKSVNFNYIQTAYESVSLSALEKIGLQLFYQSDMAIYILKYKK